MLHYISDYIRTFTSGYEGLRMIAISLNTILTVIAIYNGYYAYAVLSAFVTLLNIYLQNKTKV